MNWEKQNELWNKTIVECERILKEKGKEYAGDHDALGNFKEGADDIGITPRQVWAVFTRKHWKSITQYVKHGKTFSEEPIEGRIHDMMNFLFLLKCLIIEEKELEAQIKDAREHYGKDD